MDGVFPHPLGASVLGMFSNLSFLHRLERKLIYMISCILGYGFKITRSSDMRNISIGYAYTVYCAAKRRVVKRHLY